MNKVLEKHATSIGLLEQIQAADDQTCQNGYEYARDNYGEAAELVLDLAAEIRSQEIALESRDETIRNLSDDLVAAQSEIEALRLRLGEMTTAYDASRTETREAEDDLAAAQSRITVLEVDAKLGAFMREHMPTQAYVARRLMATYPKEKASG
jgi:chromosome segregation ATPase